MLKKLKFIAEIGSRCAYSFLTENHDEILKVIRAHNKKYPTEVYKTQYYVEYKDKIGVLYLERNLNSEK